MIKILALRARTPRTIDLKLEIDTNLSHLLQRDLTEIDFVSLEIIRE